MNFNKFLLIVFMFATILGTQVESIFGEKCLYITSSVSLKTLVDSFIIKDYVEENFSFTKPINAEILNVGVNDIYFVEVGTEKYVLRLSRADKNLTLNDSSFLFELMWLEFLKDHKIPVSFPIQRIDKQLFGIIEASEGPRYATFLAMLKEQQISMRNKLSF